MDPLASRVASRFIAALGSHDRDHLLHQVEASVHRGTEMLHTLSQQHGFWSSSIGEGKPMHEIDKSWRKILTLLKVYEHEVTEAMGALEKVEEMEAHEGVIDYPDSAER